MQTCESLGWVYNQEASFDGYDHHMCPVCSEYALFNYVYIPNYDEDLDGNIVYIGEIENGISEELTPFCPFCGANLQEVNPAL